MFTLADFEIYQQRFQSDPEWNGRRLEIRRRLQALGDDLKQRFSEQGIALDRRESLHNPHASNGKKVRRQRTMLSMLSENTCKRMALAMAVKVYRTPMTCSMIAPALSSLWENASEGYSDSPSS